MQTEEEKKSIEEDPENQALKMQENAKSEAAARMQYEKMTQTAVAPLIIKLAVPTIATMLMTNVYNLVDTAFVGMLGTSASGAVGIVFGFMAIIQAAGFMAGQGSGSIISRLLGAGNGKKAGEVASTGFACAFLLGLVITILTFLFMDSIVMGLGSTETIAPYAKTYIAYIALAAPFMTTSLVMNVILRYEGKANLGMVGMMSGGVLNMIMDPIFMFVFGMGIAGAGLSTALSQLVSFGILLSIFKTGHTTSRIEWKLLRLNSPLPLDVFSNGFPSFVRQMLNSLTSVFLNAEAAAYGDEAVAAMSIVARVIFFVFSVCIGIGQGFQPVCGFNYGAKKFKRLMEAFWTTVVISQGLLTLVTVILMLLSGSIIGIFRDDPAVIVIGTRALRLQAAALLFLPFSTIVEMMYQSTGHKKGATLMSSCRSGILFIPILLILSHLRGLNGIQEAQPAAFVLAIIPSIIFYRRFTREISEQENL